MATIPQRSKRKTLLPKRYRGLHYRRFVQRSHVRLLTPWEAFFAGYRP